MIVEFDPAIQPFRDDYSLRLWTLHLRFTNLMCLLASINTVPPARLVGSETTAVGVRPAGAGGAKNKPIQP